MASDPIPFSRLTGEPFSPFVVFFQISEGRSPLVLLSLQTSKIHLNISKTWIVRWFRILSNDVECCDRSSLSSTSLSDRYYLFKSWSNDRLSTIVRAFNASSVEGDNETIFFTDRDRRWTRRGEMGGKYVPWNLCSDGNIFYFECRYRWILCANRI